MRLRRAIPGDIPRMRELEQDCETAAHWSAAQYDALFFPDAQDRVALIATDEFPGASIMGFLIARCLPEEWEIENVAVLPGARGHGIGSQLVAAVLTQAGHRHAESIGLEVRASNAAARALYLHCGFAETGQRRGYYANPAEDAVLYRFDLRSRLPSAP